MPLLGSKGEARKLNNLYKKLRQAITIYLTMNPSTTLMQTLTALLAIKLFKKKEMFLNLVKSRF